MSLLFSLTKIIIIFTLSCPSFAQFDFKYGAAARSLPSLGGAFEMNSGYSFKLWGDNQGPFYGMIRPAINATSSVVVYDYDASITVYPISFIGFGVGHQEMTSEYEEFTWYDCEEVRCTGKMNKDYAFGKLALGYGPLLATYSYAEFRNSYTDPDGTGLPVGEYQWTTTVAPNNETSTRQTYLLGLKLGGDLLAAAADTRKFHVSQQIYKFKALVYRKSMDNLKVTFGVGSQESTETGVGTVVVMQITHILAPSMALF